MSKHERSTYATTPEYEDDWRHSAACLDEDPELFFPIGNTGPAKLQIDEAKAVCHGCEVITTCREHALKIGEEFGVWGGLSEDERRAIKRQKQRERVSRAAGGYATNQSQESL